MRFIPTTRKIADSSPAQPQVDPELARAAYSFDAIGFATLKKLIPADQIAVMREKVESTWKRPYLWKFPFLHLGGEFWDAMTHPAILEFARHACGDQFRMDHAFGVTSDRAIANLHGGPGGSYGACYYQWAGGSRPNVSHLSVGVSLTGQTKETGGVCYIPGSHKSYDMRPGATILKEVYGGRMDAPEIAVPELDAGDVVFFSESLVHGATAWLPKDYARIQLYYCFSPGFVVWRDPAEQEKYRQYARTDLERRLIEPAWSGRYNDANNQMDVTNQRRKATLG